MCRMCHSIVWMEQTSAHLTAERDAAARAQRLAAESRRLTALYLVADRANSGRATVEKAMKIGREIAEAIEGFEEKP